MLGKTSAICLVVAVTLLASCSTHDQRRTPRSNARVGVQMTKPGALLLAGFDMNTDYRVDRDEFEAGIHTAYSKADEDASGRLSVFEYKTWATKALGSRDAFPVWMSVDRNNDHSVDESEFRREFHRFAVAYGILKSEGIILADLTSDMPTPAARRGNGAKPGGGRGGGQRGGQRGG